MFSFFFFLESHFAKRFVRLLHKLHENAKGMPFSTTPGAVYRLLDGTCVANQIARLRDSRSLRYADILYAILNVFSSLEIFLFRIKDLQFSKVKIKIEVNNLRLVIDKKNS